MTPPPDSESFATLLTDARKGDRAALDQLLRELESRFRTDVERRVGNALRGRTRISDILQDAYVEVVARIGQFEGSTEAEFFTWVTRIIENSARQQHRHLTAKKRKVPSRTTELNALAAAYLRTASSPMSELERAEEVALVHQALNEMRDDHRVVIEQVVFVGRDVAEVADDLGRTEQATRMLLSRARAALTIKLDQLRRDDGS